MKIDIQELRDILIVEKSEGDVFLKGSHIFCGCCGKSVGTMKKNLKMPFKPETFLDTLKDKSVEWMIWGLKHKTCRHIMFPFIKHFNFIRLSDYKKQYQKELK